MNKAPSDSAGGDANSARLQAAAAALRQAGKLADADQLLASVTVQDPTNFAAWFDRAGIAEARRDWPAAAELFGRAAAIDANRQDVRFRQAVALVHGRDLAQAESILRAHLARKPRHADALNVMGVICRQTGRFADALGWFQQTLKADRKHIGAYVNAGRTHQDLGDFQAAARSFREVLKRQPKHALALGDLAWATHRLGNSSQGLALAQQAIAADPRASAGFVSLAGILYELGRHTEALVEIERAFALDGSDAHILTSYATILVRVGRIADGIALFKRALEIKPNDPAALVGLGNGYFAANDLRAANETLRQAVAQRPDDIYAIARLCRSLLDSRHDDEAAHAREASLWAHRALALGKPIGIGFAEFQSVFQRTADFEGMRKLGAPWPVLADNPGMHVSSLHNQLSLVETQGDRRLLLDLHRRWGERMSEAIRAAPIAAPAIAQPRGKIRIGILSSDLRQHAIAYFALPIFDHYDAANFEIYCYSFYPGEEDSVQRHIASRATRFRSLVNMTNQAAAQTIADDGLDMLFELGGSTKHNRLEIMAYRMAPVQASWLGYPHSAGLATIDYILVDPYLRPPDPALLIERPFEMPDSWVSFGRFGFPELPIEDGIPADRKGGRLTFGTMNSPYKFTPQCIAAWSRVLQEVPDARFLFVRPEANSDLFKQNIVDEFGRNGIEAARIDFIFNTRGQHLAFYNEIDIALDSFPQTGGTTTCETLWMGVPVVTLVGEAFFERLSHSNLSNAGLGDLCTASVDSYGTRARDLASDLPGLRAWRRELREQVRRSPLGRSEDWVRNFEAAIRRIVR